MSPTLDRRRAILSLAGMGAASLATAGVASAQASPTTNGTQTESESGIVVTATGIATTPSDHAIIQIVIRAQYPAMPIDSKSEMPVQPEIPAVTPDELDAVVAVILAAGVDETQLLTSDLSSGFGGGYFGQGVGVIVFQLDREAVKTLPELLEAATSKATELGLMYDTPGAMYLAEGCEDLRAEAFQNAVTVGREDAGLLADALGVELGGLTRAVKLTVAYGPSAYAYNQSDSCDSLVNLGTALRTYLPTYDSSSPNEFAIYATVELTFATA